MGFGEIYWYPNEDGGLQRITLPEPFSDAQETVDERFGESANNGDMEQYRNDWGGRNRVRIIYERFDDRRMAAKMRSLESHLKRGLPIGVAADWDHVYASYANTYTLAPGGLVVKLTGNLFFTWRFVPYPIPGQQLSFRSQNPGYYEERGLGGFDTANLDALLVDPIMYNHENGPVFVRHSDFWPVLYLDPASYDRPLVTTDRWLNWTLDLDLVEAPGDYYSLYVDTNGTGTTFDDNNPLTHSFGGASGLAGTNMGVFSGNTLVANAPASPLYGTGYDTLQGIISKGRNFSSFATSGLSSAATSGPAFWKK